MCVCLVQCANESDAAATLVLPKFFRVPCVFLSVCAGLWSGTRTHVYVVTWELVLVHLFVVPNALSTHRRARTLA